MPLILPNQQLVLNAYAVLVGQTPGNAALDEHIAFIAANGANGTAAYKTALNSIFAASTTASLAATLMTNLGLTGVTGITQAEVEAYLGANASNRVGAMIDIANALFNLPTTGNASLDAAHTAYVNSINGSYNYSIDPAHITGTTLSGTVAAGGQTLTLTQNIDNVIGTAGNDLIIGDNTGTNATATAGDQINGGAGTDTFKLYVTAATGINALTLPVLSNVENLYVKGGALTTTTTADFSALAGVTSIELDSPAELANGSTFTVKAAATQAVGLSNVNVIAAGASTVTVDGATKLNLNGSGTSKTSSGTLTVDIKSATATSVDLAATGAASKVTLTNTGANLATLNISGDKAVTITEGLVALKTVNASTATGNVTLTQTGADNQLTFTGGAGNDKVTFAAGNLTGGASGDVLDGGAGTDTLVINDTTPVYTAINAAKNFEVLALGTTGATVDVAQVTTIKAFAVNNAGTTIFNNSTNANTYTIDNSAGVTAVTVANAVGQGTADVTINNAKAAAAANTLTTLTLTGASTISLTSTNDGQAANTNVITNLVNGDNAAITVKGAADLTLSLAAGTAVGSSVDATSFTGKLNVTGSGFGDVIKGGSANDTITGGAGADTLTGNGGNDIFVFATRATTKGAAFAAADTTAGNIDKVVDFTGNGALTGDTIQLGVAANVFGTALQFTGATVANVTAVTVATAADFTALATAVQAASAGVASTNATAQVYDVTVTAGNLAGHYLIVNDDTAAVAATDTFITITGSAALNAQDFTFA